MRDDEPSAALSPLVPVMDVWVQYREYDGFLSSLSAFSNCTWVSASGEASACEADFDQTGHYSDEQRRKREAKARLRAKQLKIERQDLEKKYKKAKGRMAGMKKAVRRKWKKMREEFEFIGTMTYVRHVCLASRHCASPLTCGCVRLCCHTATRQTASK